MPVDPIVISARGVALDLLAAVLDRGRPLEQAIVEHAGFSNLAPRDRAFARLIVATVLRRLGQIDALIEACLARPVPSRRVRHILRLGVAQIVILDLVPYAAVDAAVALAAASRDGRFKGLVNAVLRRIGREGAHRSADFDLAAVNTPEWLWQSWCAAFGPKVASAIAAAHLVEPPLDLTVKGEAARWAAALGAEVLPSGTLRRRAGGLIERLPGFEEGAWWVQDAAAALPVRLLGPIEGATVIDLCAAPGGKAAQLAAAGARLVAVERDEARLARLRQNLARLRLAAETVHADAVEWRPRRPAGLVLLDAPCTSTGTIRRHPDIARLKRPTDMARLTRLQDRLLDAAADMLAPAGSLVYSVCSLQREEGEERIAALLRRDARLRANPIKAEEVYGQSEFITPDGYLRTLPSHLPAQGGLDGFFAARLQRRGE